MQQVTSEIHRLIADGIVLTSPLRARGPADVPRVRAAVTSRRARLGGVPVVLVDGNPEGAMVWDRLAAQLPETPVRLSPPGFDAPVPSGFQPTGAGYRDWLIAELEALGRPVHLVGHDAGGGHVVRVACARPDLLVSWASDSLGVFDPGSERPSDFPLEAAAARPGLAIRAELDTVAGDPERIAARTGARIVTLPGLGHRWMTQEDGRPGAEALKAFWEAAPRSAPRRPVRAGT